MRIIKLSTDGALWFLGRKLRGFEHWPTLRLGLVAVATLFSACKDFGGYGSVTSIISPPQREKTIEPEVDPAPSTTTDTTTDTNTDTNTDPSPGETCATLFRRDGEAAQSGSCGDCLPGYIQKNGGLCIPCGSGECSSCVDTEDCDLGSHCASGQCRRDCSAQNEDINCSAHEMCSPHGRCVATTLDPDGEICAAGIVEGELTQSTVMLLVDQSGSMNDAYCSESGTGVCPSRWDALEEILFGDENILDPLQDRIRFGLSLFTYSGPKQGEAALDACPMIQDTTTLDTYNSQTMEQLYAANQPEKDTPTAESLDLATEKLLEQPTNGELYIVLATDGEPDHCGQLNPQSEYAKRLSIDSAKIAFERGVTVLPLFVGGGSPAVAAHMQDLANAGQGESVGAGACSSASAATDSSCPDFSPVDSGPPGDAPYAIASSPQMLREKLESTLEETISCTIALETGTDKPTSGYVYFDGDLLPQDAADGWSLLGEDRIELNGNACARAQDGDNHFISVVFTQCGDDPTPPSCQPLEASCTSSDDCCSGACHSRKCVQLI